MLGNLDQILSKDDASGGMEPGVIQQTNVLFQKIENKKARNGQRPADGSFWKGLPNYVGFIVV